MFHRSLKGEGQMAIHFAAKSGSVDAFNILVKNGANPLEKDERNRCPFYLAAERGIDYLISNLTTVANFTKHLQIFIVS